MACVFPAYMVDSNSLRWTPREIEWTGPASLPRGTSIVFKVKTNRPVSQAILVDVNGIRATDFFEISGTEFDFPLGHLNESLARELYLRDEFGLVNDQPFLISIESREDRSPQIQTRLVGIGTAITPRAQIPIQGEIEDDYGVKRSWLEVRLPADEIISIDLPDSQQGAFFTTIDFLARQPQDGKFETKISAGTTLSVVVKSEDGYDLESIPHIGVGDEYNLDVVDDNELIRILERLEIAQRRRLEQVYREVGESRSYLDRASGRDPQSGDLLEPGDTAVTQSNWIDQVELQILFAQRALNQIDKSSLETRGVAEAFEEIRLQLINNRIDSQGRRARLQEQVVNPLLAIVDQAMPDQRSKVKQLLDLLLEFQQDGAGDERVLKLSAGRTIESTDRVLNQLSLVLNSLLKFENQNELLDLVREMIQKQELLLEETRKEKRTA
jgi:hypothetical protein